MTLSYALIILLLLPNEAVVAIELKKNDCDVTCGNVKIEYPFGIGKGCYLNSNFSVYCNRSFDPPRPFTKRSKLEIISIRPEESKIEVKSPVLSNCGSVSSRGPVKVWPFWFSHTDNQFGAVGCESIAILTKETSHGGGGEGGDRVIVGGCMSFCGGSGKILNGSRGLGACHGLDCCVTTFTSRLGAFSVTFQRINSNLSTEDDMGCGHAFMGKKAWVESLEPNMSTVDVLLENKYVPTMLDWVVSGGARHDPCNYLTANDSSNCRPNTYCSNSSDGDGYVCFCRPGYTGNPYSGCTDIDECTNYTKDNRPCGHDTVCINTEGGYICSIPFEYLWVLALAGQGCGLLVALACICWVDREFRKWRKQRLRQKYFTRNGGPLLEKELCSSEKTVKRIELFTSKELKKATEDYNQKRILGRGGQGTVYKGMLTDGRIVAVKMSKQILNASKAQQFVNEILILSRINHRNVVQVLGCCLETKFPLLVYEFVPNGTLFHYIQDHGEKYFQFSWDMRLQIAAEVAMALCYLHSQASTPIFHRDVKSMNVLLDQNCRAKVADFGISILVSADQPHKTTMVRGTHGYLDPEYFRTSKFTDKSDVYSFGVVLVELLTGLEPVFSGSGDEEGLMGLVSHFEASMDNRRLFRIVDSRVAEAAAKAEVMGIANLARKCLDLNGKNRPTMKVVAMELEWIRMRRSKASLLSNLGRKRTGSEIPNLCNPYV